MYCKELGRSVYNFVKTTKKLISEDIKNYKKKCISEMKEYKEAGVTEIIQVADSGKKEIKDFYNQSKSGLNEMQKSCRQKILKSQQSTIIHVKKKIIDKLAFGTNYSALKPQIKGGIVQSLLVTHDDIKKVKEKVVENITTQVTFNLSDDESLRRMSNRIKERLLRHYEQEHHVCVTKNIWKLCSISK